ncbi:MAG: acyltransferase [Bacteroidota bacterium]|nr:acyltransferase [Bacteroidota bacterium]
MTLNGTSFSLSLTKDETLMLKAIGILLIVIHNFSRWVYPITGECEFTFSQSALPTAIQIGSSSGWMFFKAFFNYFGHYGVQLFIFLSGYGLVQSYLYAQPTWLKFIYHRFQKLYPSLVVAILFYLIYQVFVMHQFPKLDIISELLAHLTLTATLLPGKGQSVVGPWWFYSTIFQLYLIFPLLIKVFTKYGYRWLLFVGFLAWSVTRLHTLIENPYDVNLLETFVAQMPVFILGIWFGADSSIRVKWHVALALFVLFCLGCYFSFFWPLTRVSIIILLVIIGKAIIETAVKIKPLASLLLFIGSISVYLFAIHGFMRWPFVYIINMNQNKFWIAPLMLLLFLTLSFSSAWILTECEGLWRQKLSKLKGIFSKVAFTFSLIILPVILLVWGYNWHFQPLDTNKSVNLMGNFDESNDTTRRDIKNYSTKTGEKVIWLRPELTISHIEKFKIPLDKQRDATLLLISGNVLCDSIPEECWLMAKSYFGEIQMTKNSVNLNLDQTLLNQWQPLELTIDLRSPLVMRKELFEFYFYAKTAGNVYIDQIEVKLK